MIELFFQDFIILFKQNPLGQFFGILGMCIILYGFFQSDDRKAKIIIAISMFAWITHFFLMGFVTATIAGCIGLARMLLSLKFQKNIYVFLGIVSVSIMFGFITYESLFHLIPIFTSIIGAFSFIFLEKIQFRIASLLNSFAWLFYHVNMGSIGGMTNEVLSQFILLIVILRMAGHDGHLHHYREMIHDVMHKHKDVDMGRMIFVKDTHKIIKEDGYFTRIKKKIVNRSSFKLEK